MIMGFGIIFANSISIKQFPLSLITFNHYLTLFAYEKVTIVAVSYPLFSSH
jgi:hypothetical protein